MSRDTILSTIRRDTKAGANTSLPDLNNLTPPFAPTQADQEAFCRMLESVGGGCIHLPKDQKPTPQILAPHFDGHTPTILRAHFAVIENGACWITHTPEDDRTRYTLPTHIAILLDRTALVPTMHHAYERIRELGIEDFGLFLSGPSKTADIEQALVLGAQGAMVTKVVFNAL